MTTPDAIQPEAKLDIHDELQKTIEEGDKLYFKTVQDWTKAAPKKTCPRCRGKGILNEAVVYAGIPGGCYQCVTKGVVVADSKGLKAVEKEASLNRLREMWKAYKKAIAAVEALPEYRMKAYDLREYNRKMESVVQFGQALKAQ